MASLKLALSVDSSNPNVGDIYLEYGTVRLTSNLLEEVSQLLFTRFRMFLGEWFLDPSAGVPWFQVIIGQKTPIGIVSQVLQNVIKTCPGVASLDKFNTGVISNRTIRPVFSCTLTDGTTLTEADFTAFVLPGVT